MKILLATDHSKPAQDSVEFTKRLHLNSPVDLNVFHVVADRDVPASVSLHPGWSRVVDTLVSGSKTETGEVAAQFEEMADSIETVVQRGHASDQIVSYATEHDIDLVILGATGHSALTRMFLGSVSDNVATHAPCSTLVVRPPKHDPQSPLRIMLAYDGSARSASAVDEVAGAFQTGTVELTLIHVIQEVGSVAVEFAESAVAAWEEAKVAAREGLDAKAAELSEQGHAVKTMLTSAGHVGDELCRQADETDSDILVVGDQGHDLIARFVLGSVSRYVLRHSECPVWISRATAE